MQKLHYFLYIFLQNRRATTTLSPILYLFQIPTSTLSQKLQQVLSVIVIPPVIGTQRSPGPKVIPYGIPEDQWPAVLQRIFENHESYCTVAADYGVSRETIRRLVRASKKPDSYQIWAIPERGLKCGSFPLLITDLPVSSDQPS